MTKNIDDELQQSTRQVLLGLRPIRQGNEPGGLPFRRLLAAVFRSRYLIFGTTLFGLLIGAFLAITSANSYVSTGKFVFTASGAEATKIDPTRTIETSQETIGTAATYILKTDELLRRVVERVTPERILAPYQPASEGVSAAKAFFYNIQRNWNATESEDMTSDEALKRLYKSINIDRPRFTDVLVATCEANHPNLAQDILAAYLEEAVKFHIEVYDDLEAYKAAQKAAADALTVRNQAREELRAFLEQNDISDFRFEKERLQEQEADAAARVAKARDDLKIKREQLAGIERMLTGENAIAPTRMVRRRDDITSGALEAFEQQLADLMRQRMQKRVQLRDPNHSDIKAIDRQIEVLQDEIKQRREEARNAPLIEVEVENPAYARTIERLEDIRLDITGLVAELTQATEIDKGAKVALARVLDLEPEFQRLTADLKLAEQALEAAQVTWDAAQRKKALGQGNFSSLNRFEQASLPLEKVGPNRGRLVLAATLIGLFLGLGLVLLFALPDSVVRTKNDLDDLEGLQVIGVMPRLESRNLKRHVFRRKRGW